jgi:diguanylate cyclase (GGDEF)-like protein
VEGRRAFEDRLAGALEQARRDDGLVAVIVGELLGLLVIHARFGPEGSALALREAGLRLESAVHGYADYVARIGDGEFAVLLNGIDDRTVAHRVQERIAAAFAEPVLINGHPITMLMETAVNFGPGRRSTDMDLLWRTAEESTYLRGATLQRLLAQVRGSATNLDEVAQVFADEGVAHFGLDACIFEIGDRSWQSPPALPDRPPVAELPLRAEGRTFGRFRWWGREARDIDIAAVQILIDHVAAALDRAAAIDDTELRARTDPLTGLLNRDGLTHELRSMVDAFAVAVIDLDNIKRVNDEHGHETGDRVLCDLAALIGRGRAGDLAARWGGEEIVLVMPMTTLDGAVARLTRLLEQARSFVRVGDVGPITFSAGVTASTPDESFREALARADDAMYRAKRAGRARVEVG